MGQERWSLRGTGGVKVKNIRNHRVMSVAAFSFLFAYLLSFVFEGQVLYSTIDAFGAQTSTFILAAIVAHFVGLFSCGFFYQNAEQSKINHGNRNGNLPNCDSAVFLRTLCPLACGSSGGRLCRWLCCGSVGIFPQKVHPQGRTDKILC